MNDPFERAKEALVALEQRTRYDASNRLALLTVHGLIGLVVGMFQWYDGPPLAWTKVFGPDTEVFLAAPAVLGGILLLLGLAWNRNIIFEAVGMVGILTWDGLMIFVLNRAGDTTYAPYVYLGLFSLMSVHVYTLAKYLLAREKALRDVHS